MRIFSKKALKFHHPKDYNTSASVPDQYMGTVPDWVADSKMFELATRDGSIEVIENRKDEITVETGGNDSSQTDTGGTPGKQRKQNGGSGGGDTGDNDTPVV